ncbi:MAG: hypothetical protein R3F60_28635 [bacterium]
MMDFEPMTAELRAWLDLRFQPDADRAEVRRLRDLVPLPLRMAWFAAHRRWRCRPETEVGERATHASPSGRYVLEISTHSEAPRTWAYSRGRILRGGEVIAEVFRNFGQFPFVWVEDHPAGHDYLICGEDYQGQTVIELDTGRRTDHLAPEAHEGFGFCWAGYQASPSRRTLAVSGCYWGAPYEVRLIDLSDPLTHLPIVKIVESGADYAWQVDQPDTCTIQREIEICAPTGTPADAMSEEEEADAERRRLAREPGLWRTLYVARRGPGPAG